MNRLLIAGIGNIFLGDDAFGVELARRLARRTWPEGVQVADFGIRCLDLAYALSEGWARVILLDAVDRGAVAGTLFRLALASDAAAPLAASAESHTVTPGSVMAWAVRLGADPAGLPVVELIGCQPQSLLPGGLSARVEGAVPEAERLVEELVNQFLASNRQEVTA